MLIAEIYQSKKNKKWYARIKGKNGEPVWKTGDRYERKSGALKAVNLLKSPVITIVVKK